MNLNQNINKKINDYFNIEKEVSKETLEIITWYIYQLEENRQHDLYLLAKILPEEYIMKLVSYFDGDNIQLPKKDEYVDLKLASVCFFLKKIQKWNWQQIKDFLNIPEKDIEVLSPISVGNKINKIEENLNRDIKDILKNTKFSDNQRVKKIFQEYIQK